MAATSVVVDSNNLPAAQTLEPEQIAKIQVALFDVLQSTPFKTSKQSQQMLQYIVQQTLKGRLDLLKERTIGAEVFGRRADYDTYTDPVVRTRAGEVRKRLAQYYLGEGRESTLRIEIFPGSYHAAFVHVQSPLSSASPHSVADEAVPLQVVTLNQGSEVVNAKPQIHPRSAKAILKWLLPASAAAVLAACATFAFWPQQPSEVFWQPLLDSKKPVLIYSGANAVYMLKTEFMNRYRSTHQLDTLESNGHEFVIPPDVKITMEDLKSYKNDFVTLGDLSANVRVAALLTVRKKGFEMRSGEDVAFSDLRESPTLLVGAFNNRWTMELTGDLPFTFGSGLTIRDHGDKTRTWTPTITPDGSVTLDYAIVTRIPHSKSDQPLITIAGITQSGTRAAADFITSPQLLDDFLKNAPKDWSSKSMQIVLQTKVVNNIPTSPSVVVSRYW
jgi:hypothetical protein